MTDEQPTWIIRAAKASDLNFIYSTFLKAYKHGSPLGKSVHTQIFFEEYQKVVDQILEESDTLVACLPDDPNVIVSYLIYDPGVIHFCFTKEVFRRLKIARSLALAAEIKTGLPMEIVTHKTYDAAPILSAHPELTFNPFLFYKTHKERAHCRTK